MKVAIGSPCHDRPEIAFVSSLIETITTLHKHSHETKVSFWSSSTVHVSRNALIAEQMRWGADVLVQVDADQSWDPRDMIHAVECIASGRADMIGFPVHGRQPGEKLVSPLPLCDDSGRTRLPMRGFLFEGARYVEVRRIGGIYVISRSCIERLSAGAERDERHGHAVLFDFFRDDRGALGEDVFFIRRWLDMGGKVHCDLDAVTGHVGKSSYSSGSMLADAFSTSVEWSV